MPWRRRGRCAEPARARSTYELRKVREELATATGRTAGALRVAVHRLRKEFRATLRDTIAETVLRNEDVDDELRFLLRVIVQES